MISFCLALCLITVIASASRRAKLLPLGNRITNKNAPIGTVYTIKSGDTCYSISQRYSISVANLLSLNRGIECDNLAVGLAVRIALKNVPISYSKFAKAITSNGYPTPSITQYRAFMTGLVQFGITDEAEVAMFLSQIIWESGGLQFKEELACTSQAIAGYGCPNSYRTPGDPANIFFFGRGYIQLTWSANYKAASEAIYGDSRLLEDPDLVATDEQAAWATAFWYWKTNVATDPLVKAGNFGASTNRINGGLECSPCRGACISRFEIYKVILKLFGSPVAPDNSGC